MNVAPICENLHGVTWPEQKKIRCKNRAEWHVIDKTTGLRWDYCRHCLQANLTFGHTFSIFPSRSYAKEDGLGLTMGEARRRNVCRICGEKAGARERPDGTMESFWLGHGHEYAHDGCLSDGARERMYQRIGETGPHRMD